MNLRATCLFTFGAALSCNAFTASARDIATMDLKNGLGEVLAAEEVCSFTLDQDAIKAFIEKKVPSDDMEFADDVDTHASGVKSDMADVSASRKQAFCVQEERVAKRYGFIH